MNQTENLSPFNRSGLGQIIAGEGVSAPCEWTCSQRFDGEIEVRCMLAAGDLAKLRVAAQAIDGSSEWSFEERGLDFEGQTADGGSLRLNTVDFVLFPVENELVFHVAEAM